MTPVVEALSESLGDRDTGNVLSVVKVSRKSVITAGWPTRSTP